MDAANRGKESADDQQVPRRNRLALPIYTIVPSPDTGRLVVTLRRQGANGSSRMASPDSTVDTMGDVTNISHSRKERGGLAGRQHRLRNDGCPYARHSERSGRLDAEDELKVSLCGESSTSLLERKGQSVSEKMVVKKVLHLSAGSERDYLDEQKSMVQDLVTDEDGDCELNANLAQRQDETARSDLKDLQAGSSLLMEAVDLKPDYLDTEVSKDECTCTGVEYDATIDDDDDDE